MKVGKIERDIPAPIHGKQGLPFLNLEIGESFLVRPSGNGENLIEIQKKLQSPKRTVEKQTGRKFITRVLVAEGGVRVWRIS
jgi:hypothetical protein